MTSSDVVARITSMTATTRRLQSPASSGRNATWSSTGSIPSVVRRAADDLSQAGSHALRERARIEVIVRGVLGGDVVQADLPAEDAGASGERAHAHIVRSRVLVEELV